jgi:FkbM family methyltransferase
MRDDGTIQPAKITHFTQQGFTINGVIHAGMNDGEEVYSYQDLGVENILGFEPLPSAHGKAMHDHPDIYCAQIALSDKNGTDTLIVTKGDGKGSSIFKPILESEEIKKNWRDNGIIIDHIKIKTERLDHYLDRNKDIHPIENYDCLVLDTQGNEWEVLHGVGEYLNNFKYLSIELSAVPVYENEHSAQEVIDYLKTEGFTQDSEIQAHNDIFFIRSDIKQTSNLIYRGL